MYIHAWAILGGRLPENLLIFSPLAPNGFVEHALHQIGPIFSR